ncbi:hypothetical protein [Streptomyces cavernae]|uniref:hypothetical protein n=1 Tax=Streptomyces cavernae TaxID=2259034 RepID=UPI000FEBA83A|nr:hypothetical protein [Streptomyces cavernae]
MSRSERNQISRRVLLASAGAAAGATLTAGALVQAGAEPAFGPVKIRPGDPRYDGPARGTAGALPPGV